MKACGKRLYKLSRRPGPHINTVIRVASKGDKRNLSTYTNIAEETVLKRWRAGYLQRNTFNGDRSNMQADSFNALPEQDEAWTHTKTRTSTGPVRKTAWGPADGGAHPRTAPSSFPSCPADASPGWQPGIARRHARETAVRGLPSTPRRADMAEEEPAAPWEVTANSHASIARAIEASCSRAVHMSVRGRGRETVVCLGDFDKSRPAPRLLRGARSRLAAGRQHQNDCNVVSH